MSVITDDSFQLLTACEVAENVDEPGIDSRSPVSSTERSYLWARHNLRGFRSLNLSLDLRNKRGCGSVLV